MAMAQSLVLSILVLFLAFCILQVQGIKELSGEGRKAGWVGKS